MPPFSQLGKAGSWGTVDPGFSSLGRGAVLNMLAGGPSLKDLGLGERGCPQDMGFCFSSRVGLL